MTIRTVRQGTDAPTRRVLGSDHLRFDWPTALADVPVNTELTFTFRLHGAEGAAEQVSVKTATLVEA